MKSTFIIVHWVFYARVVIVNKCNACIGRQSVKYFMALSKRLESTWRRPFITCVSQRNFKEFLTLLIHSSKYFVKEEIVFDRNIKYQVTSNAYVYLKVSTKSWRGYIFITVCLQVCLCVCLSVCLSVGDQNSSQTDAPTWTRFSINGCLTLWL